MKTNFKSLAMVGLSVVALLGCGKKSNEAQTAQSSIGQTVNASITNIGGVADDASGAAVSAAVEMPQKSNVERILEEAFLPKTAWAAGFFCSRTMTGSAGKCVRDVNCSVGPFSWSGTVELTFSNGSSCLNPSIPNPGDFFTRVTNFTRTAFNYSVQTISDAHANYLGDSLSGGSKVTREANQDLGIEILGVSKVLTASGGGDVGGSSTATAVIADMSFKTTAPVLLNHLARPGRVVRSGEVTIYHNRLKYTAVHSYKDITWSDINCPFPTSGEIDITLSGSETGTATVVFNGCGSYSVTRNGEPSNGSMDASE